MRTKKQVSGWINCKYTRSKFSLVNKQVDPPDQGLFVTAISTGEPLFLRGGRNIIGRCYKTFYSTKEHI